MRLTNIIFTIVVAVFPLILDDSTRTFWPMYIALGALVWLIISEQLFEAARRKDEVKNLFSVLSVARQR